MNEFTKSKRAFVAKGVTVAAGMHWIYAILFMIMNFNSIGEQGLFFL